MPLLGGPAAELVVTQARKQSADYWLVRDTAQALAPMRARQTGMLLLISDDSDFRIGSKHEVKMKLK